MPRSRRLQARGRVRVAEDDTRSDIFSKVLVEHVEPHPGQGRLTVLFEYPSPEAALARVKAGDPRRRRALRGLCLWRRGSPTALAN